MLKLERAKEYPINGAGVDPGVYMIEGAKVRHWASTDRTNRSCTWDDKIRREDYKSLSGNPGCFFVKTRVPGLFKKEPKDVYLVKTDEETILFEIL